MTGSEILLYLPIFRARYSGVIFQGKFVRKILVFSILPLLILSCTTTNKSVESPAFDYAKSDQGLIDLLIRQGSNPNKEHWVSFIIDCRTEEQVSKIISKAKLVGFEDDYISFSKENKHWSSSLSASMKLSLSDISGYRDKLMPLIPANLCKKVGWGASVVK